MQWTDIKVITDKKFEDIETGRTFDFSLEDLPPTILVTFIITIIKAKTMRANHML